MQSLRPTVMTFSWDESKYYKQNILVKSDNVAG
jgi:hypothetical protein